MNIIFPLPLKLKDTRILIFQQPLTEENQMANKQKILIVDDDANIANLISLYLTKECFDTRTEEDGQSALNAFKEYNPDLVLLDIMLPGIDGYEVCREIRKESKVLLLCFLPKQKFLTRF